MNCNLVWPTGWRTSVADWDSVMSASCTTGPFRCGWQILSDYTSVFQEISCSLRQYSVLWSFAGCRVFTLQPWWWQSPVASEAICKCGGHNAGVKFRPSFLCAPPHVFLSCLHMRLHNNCLLPIERQLQCTTWQQISPACVSELEWWVLQDNNRNVGLVLTLLEQVIWLTLVAAKT